MWDFGEKFPCTESLPSVPGRVLVEPHSWDMVNWLIWLIHCWGNKKKKCFMHIHILLPAGISELKKKKKIQYMVAQLTNGASRYVHTDWKPQRKSPHWFSGHFIEKKYIKKSVSQVIFRLSRNACVALRSFQGMNMMGSKMLHFLCVVLKSCNYAIAWKRKFANITVSTVKNVFQIMQTIRGALLNRRTGLFKNVWQLSL